LELSRSTSTITRELQRNGWIRPVKLRGRGRPAHSGCYQSVAAQDRDQLSTNSLGKYKFEWRFLF
jgi:IS30 family transposase